MRIVRKSCDLVRGKSEYRKQIQQKDWNGNLLNEETEELRHKDCTHLEAHAESDTNDHSGRVVQFLESAIDAQVTFGLHWLLRRAMHEFLLRPRHVEKPGVGGME